MTSVRLIGAALMLLIACSEGGSAESVRFGAQLKDGRWLCYAPTHYFPAERPPVRPTVESIEDDLRTIRNAGFDALITYSSEIEEIPRLARDLGFRSILLGIWDPWNDRERKAAVSAVKRNPDGILGVIVGNEGLLNGRYQREPLCIALRDIAKMTGKPVGTSEPLDWFLSNRRLADCSDFLPVNAHPYFSGHRVPEDAIRWTVAAWTALTGSYPNKPVILKEVGLPSAGDDLLSENAQKEYYELLARTEVKFAYFEAFDATPAFKKGAVEQSWGLWRADRTPKPIISALPWRTVK
jgi:exo-beta-1,3-glucanase (GH17 family)